MFKRHDPTDRRMNARTSTCIILITPQTLFGWGQLRIRTVIKVLPNLYFGEVGVLHFPVIDLCFYK